LCWEGRPACKGTAADRRCVYCRITDDGLALLGRLDTPVQDASAQCFDEALRELQTARRLLPGHPEILFKLGVLLSNRGLYSEACANFTEAVRLKPDFEEALQYLRFCEEKARKSETP